MLERVFREPKFRVCCLGGLKLIEAGSGTDVTPASRKTRALIGYLCVVGKPVARERLASLLWGDRGDEQARASLRQAIYELRSTPGGHHLLKTERDTIAVGEDVVTDLSAVIAAAQSDNLEGFVYTLSEWHGDFFEDFPSVDPSFDAWLQSERFRVQESLVDAAAEAVKAGITRGEIDSARKIVNLLQQRDNINEVILRLGIRLDRLAGDSAALHRRYERFCELLKSELNTAPSIETQRLFQELTATSFAPAPIIVTRSSGNAPDTGEECVRQNGESRVAAIAPTVHSPVQSGSETRIRRSLVRSGYRIGLGAIAFAILSLCIAAWIVWRPMHKAVPPRQEPLLAILPFQNLSAGSGSQYFSEGIGGKIADALRRKPQIRVVFAPSSLEPDNTSAPKALAATHILSGSAERVGSRIHVIVQLMETKDDRVVWSHAYDVADAPRPATQNVVTQIAGGVGEVLASALFNKALHANSAAYSHYLQGRALLRQQDVRASVGELETSVRLSRNFSEAWSTLAAARWLYASSSLADRKGPYDPSIAKAARAAAQRALVLDPNDGVALGVLALLVPPARLQEIDRQLERALRFEPHNPQLLGWHGEFLMFVGRNQQSFDELTRAYELDSRTPSVKRDLVLASLRTGRFEEASEIIKQDGRRDSSLRNAVLHFQIKSFLYGRNWLGLANYLNALPNRDSPPVANFIRLYRETAIALATRETERFGQLRVRWRARASINTDDAVQALSALGDPDGAFAAVQAAVNSRRNDPLLTDPEWEALFVPDLVPLRRDPRVPRLLANWGLIDYWRAANQWPDFMR